MTSCNVLLPRMIVKSFVHALDILHRITRLTYSALPLFCLLLMTQSGTAGTAGNGSHAGGTWHYYCSSNMGQSTVFFSAAFDVTAAPGTAKVDGKRSTNTPVRREVKSKGVQEEAAPA